MKRQTSPKADPSQSDSRVLEKFALRLREERVRIEPHQGRFAARIGITQKKQSFLENASREIRADYLAAVAAVGVDVVYILTGQRSDSPLLSPEATQMLNAFEILAPEIQKAALTVVRAMGEGAGARSSGSPLMNHAQLPFRAGD